MENHVPNLSFGELEKQEKGLPVPASVTLLVSLFLILLVFFIIMNQTNDFSQTKKDIVAKSVNTKFGMPTKNEINFGDIVPPRMEDFVVELEQLFQTNAKIKSTVNGDETSITAEKNFFFFADEGKFRQDRMEMLIKLQDILHRWGKTSKVKVTFTLGLENYELDKQRLENFRQLMLMPGMDVGLDTSKTNFTIMVRYD